MKNPMPSPIVNLFQEWKIRTGNRSQYKRHRNQYTAQLKRMKHMGSGVPYYKTMWLLAKKRSGKNAPKGPAANLHQANGTFSRELSTYMILRKEGLI